ncbi:hypothetical protein H1C71_015843 [Ictidomys tridecemlineatus]|nr:hypothetical protein H1C71_015843 [Ictidomys tridecemlineatus]
MNQNYPALGFRRNKKKRRRNGGKHGKQEESGGVVQEVQEPFATFKKRQRETGAIQTAGTAFLLLLYPSSRTPTSFLPSLGPDGGQEGSLSTIESIQLWISSGTSELPWLHLPLREEKDESGGGGIFADTSVS